MGNKTKPCVKCKGKGIVLYPTFWCYETVDYIMKEIECEICNGLGYIKTSLKNKDLI